MILTIPENLNDITIRQYLEFKKAIDKSENEDYINRKMIEIFCNVSEDIRDVPMSKFNEAVEILNKAFDDKPKFKQTFIMDGKAWGFIPKLDAIPFGEYVDINDYLGDEDVIHRAMSVMYRPITFNKNGMYLIEEYKTSEKYAELMKGAPLGIYMGAMVFFYRLGNELLKATLSSLGEELTSLVKKDSLGLSGDGINQFTRSLMGMLEDLTKLQI